MDDAGGDFDLVDFWELIFGGDENVHQFVAAEDSTVEVDVKRADAGRKIENSGQRIILEISLQRVDAETQIQIERERAVFDQKIFIAVLSINNFDAAGSFWQTRENWTPCRVGTAHRSGHGDLRPLQ